MIEIKRKLIPTKINDINGGTLNKREEILKPHSITIKC